MFRQHASEKTDLEIFSPNCLEIFGEFTPPLLKKVTPYKNKTNKHYYKGVTTKQTTLHKEHVNTIRGGGITR